MIRLNLSKIIATFCSINVLIFSHKLTFKTVESPSYLSSKTSTVFSLPERKRLRSSNTLDIARLRANTILGNTRFEVAAPILCNSLPNHLKFKCLKTRLMILIILKRNFRFFFSQVYFFSDNQISGKKGVNERNDWVCLWIER